MVKTWKPLEDGRYRAANPKDCVDVEGPWLTVHEVLVEGKPETEDAIIALPDNIRLCILTDTEPTIPATNELVSALDKLLCYHEAFGAFAPEVTLLRKVLADIGEGQADEN